VAEFGHDTLFISLMSIAIAKNHMAEMNMLGMLAALDHADPGHSR
jgi:hypothetical protein